MQIFSASTYESILQGVSFFTQGSGPCEMLCTHKCTRTCVFTHAHDVLCTSIITRDGSLRLDKNAKEALQGLDKGLPNPIYPSLMITLD